METYPDNITFGIHTINIRHQISRREAIKINNIIDTEGKTFLYPYGITEINVIEGKQPKDGSFVSRYQLEIRLNMSKAVNLRENMMLTWDHKNIKAVIASVNTTLKSILKLETENSNLLTGWKISRFDYGFDIDYEYLPLLILLLHISLFIPLKSRLSLFKEKDLCLDYDMAHESLYLRNSSYGINIYDKYIELQEKGITLNESDPEYYLLRFEKQLYKRNYIKKVLPNCLVKDLLDDKNIYNARELLKNDCADLWGTGDYYYYPNIISNIRNIADPDFYKYESDFKDIVNGGRLLTHKNIPSKIIDILERSNIARAFITDEIIAICDMEPPIEKIQGLYNMVSTWFPTKQCNGKFAIPHYYNGRYKTNIRIHPIYGAKGELISVADMDFKTCQRKILKKIVERIIPNEYEKNLGLLEDLKNFYTTVKDKALKNNVQKIILKVESYKNNS